MTGDMKIVACSHFMIFDEIVTFHDSGDNATTAGIVDRYVTALEV